MEKLIEIVRSYPVLYDTTHSEYIRTKPKDDLWEKIAKQLDYSDGKATKEAWRKLRECHREALRRQQKISGQQAKHFRPWLYQKQMEFLLPFMKNRATGCNPQPLSVEEKQSKEEGGGERINHTVEEGMFYSFDELDERSAPKKRKQSITIESGLQKYTEDNDKRTNKRDDLHRNLVDQNPEGTDLTDNDALHHFFMSMYHATKVLPIKYQRQIKRKIFEAVSKAEDDIECETQNLHINSQFSSSPSTSNPSYEWCIVKQE